MALFRYLKSGFYTVFKSGFYTVFMIATVAAVTISIVVSASEEEGFDALWGEVRNFRFKLTDDLLALRAQAEELAAEGMSEPLVFPDYPALSW